MEMYNVPLLCQARELNVSAVMCFRKDGSVMISDQLISVLFSNPATLEMQQTMNVTFFSIF